MAIRKIREIGDPILTKTSKPVTKITDRTIELIEDMLDTMYDAGGVGLAAVQVGVLKRIVVIDCSEDQDQPFVLINPEIVEQNGSQTGQEGCLSVPGKCGNVTRPSYAKVRALDDEFNEFFVEGEDLLARALCHELDHLDGHLYTELVEGELMNVSSHDDEDDEEDIIEDEAVKDDKAP